MGLGKPSQSPGLQRTAGERRGASDRSRGGKASCDDALAEERSTRRQDQELRSSDRRSAVNRGQSLRKPADCWPLNATTWRIVRLVCRLPKKDFPSLARLPVLHLS